MSYFAFFVRPKSKQSRFLHINQSSKHTPICLQQAPNYIIGKWIRWAKDVGVWIIRFRRRLNWIKGAPCGVLGRLDLLIASQAIMQARRAPEYMHDSTIDNHKHPTQAVSHRFSGSALLTELSQTDIITSVLLVDILEWSPGAPWSARITSCRSWVLVAPIKWPCKRTKVSPPILRHAVVLRQFWHHRQCIADGQIRPQNYLSRKSYVGMILAYRRIRSSPK